MEEVTREGRREVMANDSWMKKTREKRRKQGKGLEFAPVKGKLYQVKRRYPMLDRVSNNGQVVSGTGGIVWSKSKGMGVSVWGWDYEYLEVGDIVMVIAVTENRSKSRKVRSTGNPSSKGYVYSSGRVEEILHSWNVSVLIASEEKMYEISDIPISDNSDSVDFISGIDRKYSAWSSFFERPKMSII